MEWLVENGATIAVLLLVIVAMVLSIRLLRADGASCSGDCASCGSACSTPELKLTLAQQEKLRLIDAKAHAAQAKREA